MSRARGRQWERVARDYLEAHGLEFVESNYHGRRGELDLIMRDRDCVVFVEVRYRRHPDFGSGADSVDRRKRKRLITTASDWLVSHPDQASGPCRFDVISMSGPGRQPEVDWIQDAFPAH